MSSNVASLVLQRSQFTKLLSAVKLIENSCTDCHISEGFVRQKTNDRQSIVEMNLTNILGDNELVLGNLKQKIMLLKSFELDDSTTVTDENIKIDITTNDYHFIDPLTKMSFRKPLTKFLDNTYLSSNQLGEMVKIFEENLVFSVSISAYVAKRIRGICQGFNNESIRCDFKGGNAVFSISTLNNENTSIVKDDIVLNKELDNVYFKAAYLPFSLDNNSEITFSTYQMSKDTLVCKYNLNYTDIPISIYSLVKLIDTDE